VSPRHGKIGRVAARLRLTDGTRRTMVEEDRTSPPEADTSQPEPAPPEDEHDFLMPGPTPTSNEGCFAWGVSWVVVSVVLLVIVALMTLACFAISLLVGLL
jgi:hypothetical protein